MCSYLDVSWYVESIQPVVIAACLETELNTSTVRFPIISHASSALAMSIDLNMSSSSDQKHPQVQWLSTSDSQILNASIGAVVQLGRSTTVTSFACTIQAQWAKSTTSANFASTNYIISGSVPELKTTRLLNQRYGGQTVAIESRLGTADR